MSNHGFWTRPLIDPKRNYRFLVNIPNMPNGATWFAKGVKKPKINVSETPHAYLNHTFKYPGRVTWDDVTVTLVDPVEPNAAAHLAAVIQASGYVIPGNYTHVTTISKKKATSMLGGIQIIQLNESITGVASGDGADPDGSPFPPPESTDNEVEKWTLQNAWIKDIDFGELSYESDDLTEISLTLAYDWATMDVTRIVLDDLIGQRARNMGVNDLIFKPLAT